jgi:hypothetical protein
MLVSVWRDIPKISTWSAPRVRRTTLSFILFLPELLNSHLEKLVRDGCYGNVSVFEVLNVQAVFTRHVPLPRLWCHFIPEAPGLMLNSDQFIKGFLTSPGANARIVHDRDRYLSHPLQLLVP